MSTLEKLTSIDRRIIYLLIGVVVIVPFFIRMNMPIYVSPPVQSIYDFIESLPEGSVVMIGFNFGPSTMPELYPQAKAVLRHCYSKRLKVIGMTLYASGATIADSVMRAVADEYGYEEHKDYTYLGYKGSKPDAIILGMGEDISVPFPTDYSNTPLSKIQMMKGIKNYKDIALVVDFGSGNSPEWWVTYAGSRYHQDIAAGCTGVMVSGLYPYLKAGQLIGIIGGLKGAAEYERLIERPEKATLGMNVQSISHLAIILLVIFGNVIYILSTRRNQRG